MKKIYSFALMLCAAALITAGLTSCEGDGFDEHSVGNLENGNVSDLPYGYRVRTVGDISYSYKRNGKLNFIRIGNEKFDMSGKTLEIENENETSKYTFKFNSFNYVEKINYRFTGKDESCSSTAKFSYLNRQLYRIEVESDQQFKEDGQDIAATYDATYEFSYESQCLRRLRIKINESQKTGNKNSQAKQTYSYSFKYENTPDFYNRYYQWTPNVVIACFDEQDEILEALAYVGMLGRASRQLPYAIVGEGSGKLLNGDAVDYGHTFDCEYNFNSYDAIRIADGVSYTYTERDDDYEVKPYVHIDTRAAKPATESRSFFGHNTIRK